MKKILFFLIFSHFLTNLFAQTAEIYCEGAAGNQDCFKPDPETFVTYLARVNNTMVTGNVWTIDSTFWTATPLNQLVNPRMFELLLN